MLPLMVAGAGKIGRTIAMLLADTGEYEVFLVDSDLSAPDTQHLLQEMPKIKTNQLDVKNINSVSSYLKQHGMVAVISSLPYYLNPAVAEAAIGANAHYFDLTEDIAVASAIKSLARRASTVLVPQCGMAPGFVSIVAHSIMNEFDTCYEAKLRVGALPQQTSHALQYALTWSTDGLINEYGAMCEGIYEGKKTSFLPLDGLETIQMNGKSYEAFFTSGGLGGLAEIYDGQIERLTYKTIRYPGHCEKMRFLMQALRLNEDRGTLKKILEKAVPETKQDMVLIYVSVEGIKQGVFTEKSYVKTIYPQIIHGIEWSAIQLSTSFSVCAVLEQILHHRHAEKGLILQEHFDLKDILNSRFGRFYAL